MQLLRPEFVAAVTPGFRQLAADYYWLLAINQTGSARTVAEHRDIATYAEMAVKLDPRFFEVYRFTALAVPFPDSSGRWAHADISTRFVRDGLAVFPDSYKLLFIYATNLLFYHREYREAGLLLRKLSTYPQAPRYVAPLATRVLAQGGDIDTAVAFAQASYDAAQDDESRRHFRRRLLELEQERVLQGVDAAAKRFAQEQGRPPKDVAELVAVRLLPEYPVDPAHGIVYLDEEGRARSTAAWYRLELYDEAGKEAAKRAQGAKETFAPTVFGPSEILP